MTVTEPRLSIVPMVAPDGSVQAPLRGFDRVTSIRTFEALGSRSFRWFFVSMLAQFSSMHMQMVLPARAAPGPAFRVH